MTAYYCDGTRADDTGAGTSEATAKKTLSAGCALITAAGDVLNVKASANYTPGSTITQAVAGTVAAGPVTIRGYTTTPGDGGVATITSGSATDYFSVTGHATTFQSLKFAYTGTGARAIKAGADILGLSVVDCEFSGCSYGVDGEYVTNFAMVAASVVRCKFTGGVGPQIAVMSGVVDCCYIAGSTGDGVRGGAATGATCVVVVANSVITGCSYGINFPANRISQLMLVNSVVRSSTNDNIKFATQSSVAGLVARNSVIELAGGYGINSVDYLGYAVQRNLAFRSNTSGNRSAKVAAGLGDITLTADPWTATATPDYSLNATSGGGAALKNAGFPGVSRAGTGYEDVGPLRHQDPAGGGGGVIVNPGMGDWQ